MFDYNFIYTDTDTLQKTQQNFIKNTKEKKTKHKLPLNRKKKMVTLGYFVGSL